VPGEAAPKLGGLMAGKSNGSLKRRFATSCVEEALMLQSVLPRMLARAGRSRPGAL
jgi:hypothetical protein